MDTRTSTGMGHTSPNPSWRPFWIMASGTIKEMLDQAHWQNFKRETSLPLGKARLILYSKDGTLGELHLTDVKGTVVQQNSAFKPFFVLEDDAAWAHNLPLRTKLKREETEVDANYLSRLDVKVCMPLSTFMRGNGMNFGARRRARRSGASECATSKGDDGFCNAMMIAWAVDTFLL